jgi:hypothetical protein
VKGPALLVCALLCWPHVATAADAGADRQQLLAELDRLGRSIAAQKCPRPLEVKTSFIRNPRAADVADEMRSHVCRGFRIAVYVSHGSGPARELPMSVVLEEAHPQLPAALSIGAPAESVRGALGAPTATVGQSLSYALNTGARSRDTVTFEIDGARVQAVAWLWDVD